MVCPPEGTSAVTGRAPTCSCRFKTRDGNGIVGLFLFYINSFTFEGVRSVMPLVLISLAVIILDRVTKILVQSHLAEGESIPVVPGVMSLTYILNPGAAFGMLEHQRLFFILMTVAVIAVLIYFWRRIKEEAIVVQLGAAFFLGGAVGNLIDRIETGFVIDFFDFYFWPIFNVADIFICVGVGLIVWNIVMDECRKTEPQK